LLSRLFVFAPSWTPLHIGLVRINVADQKVQALSLPLTFRFAFHQNAIVIVNICFQLAC